MDSGLIFPIIVALWLVYLVPGWIRRREHLGSSRVADRFSVAMRVLDRPEERPAPQARPVSGGYVLTPPRPAAASLVVKRPQPVDPAPARALAPSLVAPPPNRRDQATPGVIKRSGREQAIAPRRRSRVPGLTLLAMLVALPVTVVLAVLDVVPPVTPAVPLGLVVLCLVALRRSALRRRRQATRPVPVRPAASAPAVAPCGPARSGSGVLAELMSDADPVSADPDGDTRGEPWTPVPVPPPTYTLKPPAPARRPVAWSQDAVPAVPAPRPRPDAGAVAEPAQEPTAQPAARRVVPDLALVLERRRASGE